MRDAVAAEEDASAAVSVHDVEEQPPLPFIDRVARI
jgi:hypothetical protein